MAKIIGNTTATPNPRPDWNQTDPTKADYIKNKPSTLAIEITDGVLTLTQNNFTYKSFIDNNTLTIQ